MHHLTPEVSSASKGEGGGGAASKQEAEDTAAHRAALAELEQYDEEVADPVARREVGAGGVLHVARTFRHPTCISVGPCEFREEVGLCEV